MKKKNLKVSILFAIFLSLLFTVKEPVYAVQTNGTITIILNRELGSKEGVEFNIYKVGEWDLTTENWKLVTGLTSAQFSALSKTSDNSAWISAANDLSSQIEDAGMLPAESKATDESGKLISNNLDLGMYLVIQEGANNYGTIEPFLISLPYKDNNGYNYSPEAYPKATAFPSSEGNTPTGNNKPAQSSTSNTNQGESTAPSGQSNSNEAATVPEADIEETEQGITPVTNNKPKKYDTPISDDESEADKADNEEADNNETALQENVNDITKDEPVIQESNEAVTDDNASSEKGINPITVTFIAVGITAVASSGGFIFFKILKKK